MARKKKTAVDLHYEQQRKAHEAAMWSATLHSSYPREDAKWAAFTSQMNAEDRRRELNGE